MDGWEACHEPSRGSSNNHGRRKREKKSGGGQGERKTIETIRELFPAVQLVLGRLKNFVWVLLPWADSM